jgi:hypothetical protein
VVAIIISKLMVSALEDKKQRDTPLKATALEWLGDITSKIRERGKLCENQLSSLSHILGRSPLHFDAVEGVSNTIAKFESDMSPLDLFSDGTSRDCIQLLWETQSLIISYLGACSDIDPSAAVSLV